MMMLMGRSQLRRRNGDQSGPEGGQNGLAHGCLHILFCAAAKEPIGLAACVSRK
jgi:hypothetical protein